MIWIAAAAAVALAAGLLLLPTVIRGLIAADIVDRPDRERKLHDRVVPVGGGIAVCAAMLVGTVVGWPVIGERFAVALAIGAVLLTAAGLFDDARGLRGRQKLAVQFLIAALVVYGGDIWVSGFEVFGRKVGLGVFGQIFAVLWIVGTINAVNLLDGADGLASIVGITLGSALVALCVAVGKLTEAVMPAALVGALFAFLRFNLPPARIFLGDAGSQLIGLVLGASALQASLKGPTALALTSIVAIWSVPIFDVGIAILRRRLTGRSLYYPDRGHLHHRLIDRGLKGWMLLLVVGVLCGLTAAGAVVSVAADNEVYALVSVGAVLGSLVLGRFFGHSEMKQLAKRSYVLAKSIVTSGRRVRPLESTDTVRLRGKTEWDAIWGEVQRTAAADGLSDVRLIVHVPTINEDYSSTWRNTKRPAYERTWRVELPLVCGLGTVGRLELSGPMTAEHSPDRLAEVLRNFSQVEASIIDQIETEYVKKAAAARVEAGLEPLPGDSAFLRTVRTTTLDGVGV